MPRGPAARATGRPLPEVLAERVLEPLGMTDTAFYQPESKRARFAESQKTNAIISGVSLYYDYAKPTPYMQGGGGISSTAATNDSSRPCENVRMGAHAGA